MSSLCEYCFSCLFSHGFVTSAGEQGTNIKAQPQLHSHRSAEADLSFARITQDLYSHGNACALGWRPAKHLDVLGLKWPTGFHL